MGVYEMESVVRGHHIYKSVWTPYSGEVLTVEPETRDQYAVAILNNDSVVGHVPREMSRICYYFIRSGGSIDCKITGKRKVGKGLEVPCLYLFNGSSRLLKKLKKLLDDK